jgi:germination protein M
MARRRSSSSVGCLFWVALILLILVVALLNQPRITKVLQETEFFEVILQNEEPEVVRNDEEGNTIESPEPEVVIDETPEEPLGTEEEEVVPEEEETAPEPPDEETTEESSEELVTAPVNAPSKVRRARLWFIELDSQGNPRLKETVRSVEYSDSPLTSTLTSLIEGLYPSELNKELQSLIPVNITINRIWVTEGVAHIDFSEQLAINDFGVEGIQLQLQQIVYTATEFSTVNSVQFYVDGKKREYLVQEGIYVGSPISRDDFPL